MACTIALVTLAAIAAVASAEPHVHAHLHRRGGVGYGTVGVDGVGYGGIGGFDGVGYGGVGYGGWGWGSGFFPFAASSTNAFNANSNFANYHDDTLYVNNVDATTANSNVNTFNQANVVA
ncbi:hypothetical protein H4R19_004076 [Coemansia spiralis]|nr:hypothetical protein H4R19_004076 [Coemansia spiralis]